MSGTESSQLELEHTHTLFSDFTRMNYFSLVQHKDVQYVLYIELQYFLLLGMNEPANILSNVWFDRCFEANDPYRSWCSF